MRLVLFVHTFISVLVENRVLKTEQIVMGTSGTVLDWILKRKVSGSNIYMHTYVRMYVYFDMHHL